ncbi:protein TANC2 isoform X2 [Triticum aestivum]|uniref:protein TANC2 isoform X2 n=1 Tax=Triticum aestivum TaxID=4565 RepID=UPI001D024415|nr:protein TANC2-like isoform X2 [Triticum aestivum]
MLSQYNSMLGSRTAGGVVVDSRQTVAHFLSPHRFSVHADRLHLAAFSLSSPHPKPYQLLLSIHAMAPPGSPAPFTVGGPVLNMIFQAASDGDLPLFKRLVTMLDMGRGRLKETVEALRVEDAGLLQGLGALHVAANRGRLEVCRYLVEELQVDVNAVDKGGRTPLFFAISCKGVGIAKYLLDHGANPNKSCHDGLSPLHEATASGHDGILKILLDHNADRNKEVNGKTPLIAAVDADSRNCMLLLIRAGADTKGALTYAAENLHSQKLVSTDFVNCIKEDAAANRVLPDDDEPVSKSKTRAAGFKKLANNSFKKKDYFSAAGSYSVAMMLDPDDATMYSNRSLCSLRMGDGDKALIDANECRKMRPDWPTACYRQGAALMLLKDYKGACEHFLDGLKLDPANTEIEDALRKAYDAMQDVSQHQG